MNIHTHTYIHTVCEGGGVVIPLELIILPLSIVTDYLTIPVAIMRKYL